MNTGTDNFPFEIAGYFEEYIDLESEKKKFLGTRKIEKPENEIGSKGWIEVVITEPLQLTNGRKQVVIKASPERPRKLGKMVQVLCGKRKD